VKTERLITFSRLIIVDIWGFGIREENGSLSYTMIPDGITTSELIVNLAIISLFRRTSNQKVRITDET